MKFYPSEKGGQNKFCGSFYTVVLAILKGGGCKTFPLFKRGA